MHMCSAVMLCALLTSPEPGTVCLDFLANCISSLYKGPTLWFVLEAQEGRTGGSVALGRQQRYKADSVVWTVGDTEGRTSS